MFKNLLKKSRNLQPKLGRWGVTYDLATLDKRINWANHDHCGSEVCENHFINEKQLKKDKEGEKKDKKKVKKKGEIEEREVEQFYYVPYCL